MSDALAVRPERDDDADAVRRVLTAAFGDEEGGRIVDVLGDLRSRGDLRSGLVASLGDAGDVVGYVALSRAWVDARERLVEGLVLSPLAVLPDRQGRGVGTRLLAAAVEAADDSGAPLVFLEGSPAYYGARGWEPAAAHGLVRPSRRIPEAACQVRLLSAHEPWMTGALVYTDAWWRGDLVGLRDPVLAEIEGTAGP